MFAVCPEGYFGDHCLDPCECDNDNFICDPAKGCVCRAGFAGVDCQPPSAANRNDKEVTNKEDGLGSAGAGVLVALLLVLLLLIGAVFYYRRRFKPKLEVPPVHYRVEKNPEGKPRPKMPELIIIFVIFRLEVFVLDAKKLNGIFVVQFKLFEDIFSIQTISFAHLLVA